MITFEASRYDGYIFDCDGTLADTMPLHYQAWNETLALKLGRSSDFTEAMFYRFGGMPARAIIERLNQDHSYGLPVEQTAEDKEARFVELLPGISAIPEVMAVLNELPEDGKIAVATGGYTHIVRDTLRFIGLEVGPGHKIKLLVGSDQVKHGKPNPELFLRAAELLEVAPDRCLVFEDAEPGFVAAQAAGMDYIDVRPYRAGLAEAAKY
jgi:HAD superfamily hydrolase (TIGR01509 family)